MKKSLILASLVVASTSMMAIDVQYFLGAGAESANGNFKTNVNAPSIGYSETFKKDDKDTALKLKLGVILDKTHRISLSHSKFGRADTDVTVILANYDYLIPVNNEFRLYTGIHAGKGEYKETNIDIIGTAKMSGLAYGAQVGVIYDITKNVEFELGLAYTKYNLDRTINWVDTGVDVSQKLEIEDSTSMFAGINYKF
jgi:opacity protein-like surface antigen